MEIKKENKIIKFFKKFGYYVVAGVLVVAVGVTLALTLPKSTEVITPIPDPDPGVETGSEPISFTLPIVGATVGMDCSFTELTWNQTLGHYEAHFAIDFIAGESLSVLSVESGKVIDVSTTYDDGTSITIEHRDGFKSVYKSLSKDVNVAIGAEVSKGQIIGTASADAAYELEDGNHLHFELYKDGAKVDPNNYLNIEGK